MASPSDSSLQFFQKATPCQWKYVLTHYKDIMKIHAQKTRGFKKNGPEELMKLDTWFQETLPKNIHARKDIHVTRDELIQITKWKLIRGKARSRLLDLVRLNTDLAVKQTTQKAFKKLPNLSSAINALTNLKGVGPQTASAVLCAGYPEHCPFMADEAMLATPGVEASDYTLNEFVNYATQIKNASERLNAANPEGNWSPHSVEMTLWVHYLSKELKPSILKNLPLPDGSVRPKSEDDDDDEEEVTSSEDHCEGKNGESMSVEETTGTNGNGRHATSSLDEDSNISVPVSGGGSDASVDDKSNDENDSNESISNQSNSNQFNSNLEEGDDSSVEKNFRTPNGISSSSDKITPSSLPASDVEEESQEDRPQTQNNSVTTAVTETAAN